MPRGYIPTVQCILVQDAMSTSELNDFIWINRLENGTIFTMIICNFNPVFKFYCKD